MLQQRVKYMRITPIFNQYSVKKSNTIQQNTKMTLPLINTRENLRLSGVPAAYFVSFKGYSEDARLINDMENLLDYSVNNVKEELYNKFSDTTENGFVSALHAVQEDENLYSKITKTPEIFNQIEQNFEDFDRIVLNSLEDVRYSRKHYSDYWKKHSKIGDKFTADIICEVANAPSGRINKIVKQSDEKDFKKIKNQLIKTWFEAAVENISKEKSDNAIKENIATLANLTNLTYANTFVMNEKVSLFKAFNNRTKEKILSYSTSDEQKLDGFKVLLEYVEKKLLEDKGEDLKKDFETLFTVKKALGYAKEKESFVFAYPAIKNLHNLAFQKWEKDNFKSAINTKLEKEIFTKKEEKENKKLHYFQNYPNFDTDSKYFVARYYNARYLVNNIYDYDDKDYLLQIINDRHNTKTPLEVIRGIGTTLNENKNVYFRQLDNFYDLILAKKEEPTVDLPQREVQTPNDKLSFADLYLEKLGKIDLFKRCSEDEKLKYLSTLTRDEISILNEEIKKEWYLKDEKYAILDEVSRQAKATSVFLGMYEELKKINLNLEEIKIITRDATYTLKDVLENRTILSSSVNENSNVKLSSQISEMQRQYQNATPQQQAVIDENISKAIPALVKVLSDGQKDSGLNAQLNALSHTSLQRNSANHTFEFVKNMLISRGIWEGINTSKKFGKHLFQNGLANQPMPNLSPVDAITNVGTGSGVAGAGWLSQFGVIPEPTTMAVTAVLVACIGTIVAVNKASNLERNQRDLIFKLEI